MPKIHDKVFLQIFDDEGNVNEEVTWCEDRISDSDVEYARVGAVQHTLAADGGDAPAISVASEISRCREWFLNLTEDDEPITQELVVSWLNIIERALVKPTAAKA